MPGSSNAERRAAARRRLGFHVERIAFRSSHTTQIIASVRYVAAPADVTDIAEVGRHYEPRHDDYPRTAATRYAGLRVSAFLDGMSVFGIRHGHQSVMEVELRQAEDMVNSLRHIARKLAAQLGPYYLGNIPGGADSYTRHLLAVADAIGADFFTHNGPHGTGPRLTVGADDIVPVIGAMLDYPAHN